MLKKFLAAITLGSMMVLIGACSRSPVVKLYEGPQKPESDLAIVRVPVELEVLSINGRRVEGVNSLFSVGYKDLHLEPGKYHILAFYKDLWDIDADTHDVIKSDPALFPLQAEAGHHYRLGFDEPQSIEQARELEKQFSGHILDVTTGEKTASRPSGVAFRSGLLGSIGDIAGVDTTTAAAADSQTDGGQAVAPMPAEQEEDATTGETGTANPAPAVTGQANTEASGADSGYLDMLKAYWSQATPEERRNFLRWVSEQK